MSKSIFVRFILFMWSALLFFPTQGHAEKNDGWSLHMKNRRTRIIQRLQQMLKEEPFSEYALRRLLSFHLTPTQKNELQLFYERRLLKHPKEQHSRAILARLLEKKQEWVDAWRQYKQLHTQRPTWFEPLLGIGRCLFAMKRHKAAIDYFQRGLKMLKGQRKHKVLKKLLRAALKSKQRAVVLFSFKTLKPKTLPSEERLTLARLLVEHQEWTLGLPLYEKILKTSKGAFRVRLLLELCRANISAKQFGKALKHIKAARKVSSIHDWFLWELQMHEVEVFRHQRRLPELLHRLSRSWKRPPHSKDFRKVQLLAQLHEETKQPQSAKNLYIQASQLKPGASEPRLRLIALHLADTEIAKTHTQMHALIKHDVAAPQHYITLARHYIKQSLYPVLQRWHPSWRKRYHCPSQQRLDALDQKKPLPRRCDRLLWQRHRSRMARFWSRYLAEKKTLAMRSKAKSLLQLCAQRHQNNWQLLFEMESLFDQYGFKALAQQTQSQLIRQTRVDLDQLQTLRSLLWQLGKLPMFKHILLRLLRSSFPVLRQAVTFSTFAYAPPPLPAPAPEQTLSQSLQWQKTMCPDIGAFLKKVRHRIPDKDIYRFPKMALQLSILQWRCGEKAPSIQRFIKKTELQLMATTPGLEYLLKTSIQYQYPGALKRLLTHPRFKREPRQLLQLLRPMLKKELQESHLHFMLDHVHQALGSNQSLLIHLLNDACQVKSLCTRLKPYFEKIIRAPHTHTRLLLRTLGRAMQHQEYLSERSRWLALLQKSYWNHPTHLHHFAEATHLFNNKVLKRLHLKIVLRCLQKRQTAPHNLRLWGSMLQEHLKKLYPNRSTDTPMIEKLEAASRRFNHLYRQVLAFYLYNYRFRQKYGIVKLKKWLLTRPQLDDLLFIERYSYYIQRKNKSWMYDLVKQLDRAPLLRWLALYAQKKGDVSLHVHILKRLLQLRPKDTHSLKRIVEILDRTGKPFVADPHALALLQQLPKYKKIRQIKDFVQGCCADQADQHRGRRLLVLGLRRFGLSNTLPQLKTLLPKLSGPQRDALLKETLLQTKGKKSTSQTLPALLEKYGSLNTRIILLRRLLHTNKQHKETHKTLADLLDRQGKANQATPHWRKAFVGLSLRQQQQFFQQRTKKALASGDMHLAGLSHYRSLIGNEVDSLQESRAELETLHKHSPSKAWGMWLWLQGKQSPKCLKGTNKHFPQNGATAQLLLQLNAPYSGPLVYFPRCQWLLPRQIRYELVTTLLQHLKNDPHRQILIEGHADPNTEIDLEFLARQRTHSLQQALIDGGIPSNRIKLSFLKNSDLPCRSLKQPAQRTLCHRQLRRVSIHIQLPNLLYKPKRTPTSFLTFLTHDADRDNVPDYLDKCPITSITKAQRYRYFYRYRSRTSHSSPITQHPLFKLYPGYSYRSSRYYRYRPARSRLYRRTSGFLPQGSFATSQKGCPPNHFGNPQLKRIHEDIIETDPIPFYRNSNSIRSYGYGALNRLSALLRLMPRLGRVRIELLTVDERYKYRRRRYRYRRRYNSPKSIAKRRANRILNYLKRQGVNSTRLSIETLPHNKKTKRPKVLFRLLDFPSKNSPYPRHDPPQNEISP